MIGKRPKTTDLVLPKNYELISEDEAREISGGNPMAIIKGAIIVGGTVTGMGVAAAEALYYNGYPNSEYQKNKWAIRSGVLAILGPITGPIFMISFQNKYYSLVEQRGW